VDFLSIVEPSEEMALRVRNRLGKRVEVFVSTIEEFASSGRFDNIFLVHTLEHLDDPVRGLISISNLLTSDGKIFVMVPNANAVSRQIATAMGMLKNPREVMDSEARQGHLRTYDQHSLKTDLEAANLKIIHSGGVVLKALANFQFDIALSDGLISREYMAAADSVGNFYPDLCGSIFSICKL
jgi:2-polyprenyl-3-methyl-5-hydroxy-6-metoxy-1,4-benzoquinol methylase